jgi:hypothetical protein
MWTQTENAELLRLWPTHRASEIAAKLGKTRNAVIGRMHRNNGTYAGRIYGAEIVRREQVAAARKLKVEYQQRCLAQMKKNIAAKTPRNVAIKQAVESGATLRAVGAVIGITGQAVSLIVLKRT